MARLEEHEVLYLIDCVRLGMDQSRALVRLIQHCKTALNRMYYHWQADLTVINKNSKTIMESVFGRAIYQACLAYDETKGAAFHSFAFFHVSTAVRREIDLFVYKHSGVMRQLNCRYMHAEDDNNSWTSDEYSCGNRCGWQWDNNKSRPCKVYYAPPKPKTDQLLQKLQEREPMYLLRPGSTKCENVVAGKNEAEGAVSIQHTSFVSLDETQKNDKAEDGPDPGERYMFESLQQEFQLNPVEDANISGTEVSSEEEILSRMDNLPARMREIITDLRFGINGVFNVEAVAWKHGITPDEVIETVVACIQRLRRLGLNE